MQQPTPSQAAALAHYLPMAAAAVALIPKPDCTLREVSMGPATVTVECRPEDQEFASGRVETFWIIEGALINGVYVPYSDEMADWFERWSEEIAAEERAG